MKSKKSSSKTRLPYVKLESKLQEKATESRSFKSWVSNRWAQFETWVHSWFPGLKTKIMLWLGMLGTGAATLQEFVGGLPITDYISTKTMSLVTLALFAMAFWFKGMGDRVEAKAEELT